MFVDNLWSQITILRSDEIYSLYFLSVRLEYNHSKSQEWFCFKEHCRQTLYTETFEIWLIIFLGHNWRPWCQKQVSQILVENEILMSFYKYIYENFSLAKAGSWMTVIYLIVAF